MDRKNLPCFVGRRGLPAVTRSDFSSDLYKLSVAGRKTALVNSDVVFQSGAHRVRAASEGPPHNFCLMSPDPCSRPSCLWKKSLRLSQHDVEYVFIRRQGIFDAHNELNVDVLVHDSLGYQIARAMDVREIEYLDFRANLEFPHLHCEIQNQ